MIVAMPLHHAGRWFDLGHRVVASLAEQRLTPHTAEAVRDILDGQSLADASVWADNIKQYRHDADALHYVNIPLTATAYDSARDCPHGSCIIAAIASDRRVLANPSASPLDRAEALRFLIHFMGDLHQPLHAADNQDRGGNCVPLALGGPRTVNLHSYWDTVAVEAIDPDADRLARTLAAEITPAQRKVWEQGDARTWALESFAIAKASVYTLGSKPGCATDTAPVALPVGYGETAKAVVAEQLKKAGVRLALELNRALG